MNDGLILVTGGSRSGKSLFAQELADSRKGRKVFVATAEAFDDEMRERIELHRSARPPEWDTVEEPLDLAKVLQECSSGYQVILVDCLTLWISNLLLKRGADETDLHREIETILATCVKGNSTFIIVTNEVGMGIVPRERISRLYRDMVGRANQLIASRADRVFLLVAGIPLELKAPSRQKGGGIL